MENDRDRYCEKEIDLLNLLAYLLRRWKSIFAAMLVFVFLLAGYKYVSTDTETVTSQAQAEYEFALAEYNSEKDKARLNVEAIQQGIDDQKSYINRSVLFGLNPVECPQAGAVVLVAKDDYVGNISFCFDKSEPDHEEHSKLASYIDMKSIGERFQLSTNDIRDILEIRTDENGVAISLTAYYTDLESANAILDAALLGLDELYSELGISPVVISRSESIARASYIYNNQNTVTSMLAKQESNLNTAKKIMNGLTAPAAPINGMPSSSIVKFAVIGAFVGAFVMAAFYCVAYIFSGKVRTDSDLQNAAQSSVLGIYSGNADGKGIKKLASAIEGSKYYSDKGLTTAEIAAYIRTLHVDVKQILLMGICSEDKVKTFAEKIENINKDREFVICSNMDGMAEIEMLEKTDVVIIVAEKDVAKMHAVQQKSELARMIGKPIAGCVMV